VWLVLLITFVLRIPSFFEPAWYGDEGIYLAIGQAIQRGAVLYRDIWDNKPPLLYLIYAVSPTLLWAKLTAAACVLGTVLFVKKITKNNLAALICGIFLSIPLLEGTIANAELYFILPTIIIAFLLITPNPYPLATGVCLAIAFLIKIPAIFDFLGLFLAFLIISFARGPLSRQVSKLLKFYFIVTVPLLFSLVFLIVYFYVNYALADFFTAVFVQNSNYVAIDSGPFSKLSNPLFIKGIILLISEAFFVFLYFKNKISKEFLLLSFWFGFSLYGALLSNRPYAHYLLQIVPPSVILFFYLVNNLKKYFLFFIPLASILYILSSGFNNAFRLPTAPYYQNFFKYITRQQSWENYANWFDSRTVTNYQITKFLDTRYQPQDTLFVWGDNAFIYALSQVPPATKFIQAHHLTTISPNNYDKIIEQLNRKKPKHIVVIRPVRFAFTQLEELISRNYKLVITFGDNHIYQILGDIGNKPADRILGPGAKK
jgi:hypothetical protein